MKKRTIFTLILFIGAIFALIVKLSWTSQLKVGVALSHRGNIEVNVKATGKLDEATKTEVYSPVESVIASVNVREGDYVQNNVSIAELGDGKILKSPVAGVALKILAKVGMPVTPQQPIAIIGDMKSLVARVNLPEGQVGKVKVGQKAEITCPASSGRIYNGTVSSISPSAKIISSGQGNRTVVEAVIEIQDIDGLKSGYTAEATILAESKNNSVVVPFEAVSDYKGNKGVWIEKGGIAHFSKVTIGDELELDTEIKEGLNGGEKVIISPPKGMAEGVRVEVKP